ncbi:MAG: antibiotic biosynthesis monooxygenase [Burkholderiales bacterium]
MKARVVTVKAQPGKMDEMTAIYKDSVVPAGKKQTGFKGAMLLTDADGSKGISITLWETEADMTAGETNGYYQEQIGKMKPLMSEPPVLEHCDVSVQA